MERQDIDDFKPVEEMLGRLQPSPPRAGARERILGAALEATGIGGQECQKRRFPVGSLSAVAALIAVMVCSFAVERYFSNHIRTIVNPQPAVAAASVNRPADLNLPRDTALEDIIARTTILSSRRISEADIIAQRQLMKEVLSNGT